MASSSLRTMVCLFALVFSLLVAAVQYCSAQSQCVGQCHDNHESPTTLRTMVCLLPMCLVSAWAQHGVNSMD